MLIKGIFLNILTVLTNAVIDRLQKNEGGKSPLGVLAKVQICGIVVSKFEL